MLHETIRAYGHPMIRATHRTTFEITKDPYLTPRGDCIIGVNADKSADDLDPRVKDAIRRDDAIIIIVLRVGQLQDIVLAQGSAELQLSDQRRIIIRRSTYIEPATLAIKANKAARDIDRTLIDMLRKGAKLTMDIYILGLDEIRSPYKNVGGIINDFSSIS